MKFDSNSQRTYLQFTYNILDIANKAYQWSKRKYIFLWWSMVWLILEMDQYGEIGEKTVVFFKLQKIIVSAFVLGLLE